MMHTFFPAPPSVADFVEFFWASAPYYAESPRERVLPTGCAALVVPLDERPACLYASEDAEEPEHVPGAFVCGPRRSPLIIGTAIGPTVGVHFKPGAARAFFDAAAADFADGVVQLESL
jgi:hypothetical protein